MTGSPASTATNLLADRLRDLEAAGVVERRLSEDRRALLHGTVPADRSATVGVTVNGDTDRTCVQLRATPSGIEVSPAREVGVYVGGLQQSKFVYNVASTDPPAEISI